MKNRPLILISNDDSYAAAGVRFLIDALADFGDIVAICPDAPRSGQSMAITVNEPLRVTPLDDYNGARIYKVNGTPVDCIKLSMHHILPRRPDLVVAGINHGSNSAINVLYSGTMGAVMEGCAFGIPSIGFSLCDHAADADFNPCLRAVRILVEDTLRNGLPADICLNVNVPKVSETPREMRRAVPCRGNWNDEYKEYTDPSGHKFYWLTGQYENLEPDNTETDEWCLSHGIISVVPVMINRSLAEDKGLALEWLAETCRRYGA